VSALDAPCGDTLVVIAFDEAARACWQIVNDGVMGGVSSARVSRSPDGAAVFEGVVSLENNGGFASARTPAPSPGAFAGRALTMRVRGDGKRYQLRVHTPDLPRGTSYRARFDTEAGRWLDVTLPAADFRATCRGRELPDAPALDPGRASAVGFLIGDGQAGPFRLEIRHVGVVR